MRNITPNHIEVSSCGNFQTKKGGGSNFVLTFKADERNTQRSDDFHTSNVDITDVLLFSSPEIIPVLYFFKELRVPYCT